MLRSIWAWFNQQVDSIEKSHSETVWQLELDTAVSEISLIEDLETEVGRNKLKQILHRVRVEDAVRNQNIN
jgi:hypothetical protein